MWSLVNFLPSVALWDANNHLLNSALGGLAYRLFGPEPLFIRLPNVLGFLVYAFYLHLITGRIGSTAIRFGVRLAVLMAAFALEFLFNGAWLWHVAGVHARCVLSCGHLSGGQKAWTAGGCVALDVAGGGGQPRADETPTSSCWG
jgi:hypothetical protein